MANQSAQAPNAVVMIRPHHFMPNGATAADNAFQAANTHRGPDEMAKAAYGEVSRLAEGLAAAGVRVHVFEDHATGTPDSVFPNNWISTHAGGDIAIYPMYHENRRRERRSDVIDMLKVEYRVQEIVDYSGLEQDHIYLEGTGALVLDHIDRVAYVAASNRTNEVALERFCTHFKFEPMLFSAIDRYKRPIYHTNVLMCIGTKFALIGSETVTDPARRAEILERLAETGREIIDLALDQIENFAGNAIELQGRAGRLVALSERAYAALSPEQRNTIEKSAELLPFAVPTIELAGGSVRCMLAGIHLSKRPAKQEKAS